MLAAHNEQLEVWVQTVCALQLEKNCLVAAKWATSFSGLKILAQGAT